jgi:hypothetical protein
VWFYDFLVKTIMELIEYNPFRLLGLTANATPSARSHQANRIEQYLRVGQVPELEFDITPPLDFVQRTKELMDQQPGRIHATRDKILYALFWFVEANGIDKIALGHLTRSKDIEKALLDFSKGSRGFVSTPDSYSAILNHSTLEIISFRQHRDVSRLKKAITNKFGVVSDQESLGCLRELVAPEENDVSVQEILNLAMPRLKELLRELLPSENTNKMMLEIFRANEVIYPDLRTEVVDDLVQQVERLVHRTENNRESELAKAYTAELLQTVPTMGEEMLDDVEAPLREIKELLGETDPVYTNCMQKVYEEVNYCGVLPFNKYIEKLNSTEGSEHEQAKREANISEIVSLYSWAKENLLEVSLPIKETILKNLDAISENETEKYCQLCTSDRVCVRDLKVQLHKMTSWNKYSYFKDGGLRIPACSRCFFISTAAKAISLILAILVLPVVFFLIILKRYYSENDFKWMYKVAYKQLYGRSVKCHPTVEKHLKDGYQFGMP